jgi:hypothetical protein
MSSLISKKNERSFIFYFRQIVEQIQVIRSRHRGGCGGLSRVMRLYQQGYHFAR